MANVNDGLELLLRLNATIPASINSLAEDIFGVNNHANRIRVSALVSESQAKGWCVSRTTASVCISHDHAALLCDTFCPQSGVGTVEPEAFGYLPSVRDLQALVDMRARRRGRDISEQ